RGPNLSGGNRKTSFPALRMRRLRRTSIIRELVREVVVTRSDLIQPVFIDESLSSDTPIPSMPGQNRIALSTLVGNASRLRERGVKSVILFGVPRHKDPTGLDASDENGVVQQAVGKLKDQFGDELVVFTDVCMCQYTDHGHCGVVRDG